MSLYMCVFEARVEQGMRHHSPMQVALLGVGLLTVYEQETVVYADLLSVLTAHYMCKCFCLQLASARGHVG